MTVSRCPHDSLLKFFRSNIVNVHYSNNCQLKFVEDNSSYHFKILKGCLPQIILLPFVNIFVPYTVLQLNRLKVFIFFS